MELLHEIPVLPKEYTMTLTERSSCGISIYGHDTIFKTTHAYPIIMYHDPDKTPENLSIHDTESLVWGGKRGV